MDTLFTFSSESKDSSSLVKFTESDPTPSGFDDLENNLFLKLPKRGRSTMISFLCGRDNMALNNAMLHAASRKALHKAYEGTVVRLFEFQHASMPFREEDFNKGQIDICEGLRWALDRHIDVRDFTLHIPGVRRKDHLCVLIWTKRLEMARQLISRCTTSYCLDVGDDLNRTPLMWATIYGFTDLVRLLCQKPGLLVDVHQQTSYGETALHYATSHGQMDIMRILLDAEASTAVKDKEGLVPLHHAALNGSVDGVQLLVERGADVNTLDGMGRTPLEQAKARNNAPVARFLRSKNAMMGSEVVDACPMNTAALEQLELEQKEDTEAKAGG
jgi:hypothetical protein